MRENVSAPSADHHEFSRSFGRHRRPSLGPARLDERHERTHEHVEAGIGLDQRVDADREEVVAAGRLGQVVHTEHPSTPRVNVGESGRIEPVGLQGLGQGAVNTRPEAFGGLPKRR